MLKKADRLTTEEIETLSQGKSVFGTLLSLRYVHVSGADGAKLKFAVSVSKKVFKTAVERNRARRRVYGAIDMKVFATAKPTYVMFMPKKEAITVPIEQLKNEVSALLARVL
jgi:ribonuclease P protein component